MATKTTAEQTPAAVDLAEVKREAQKALAESIKNARKAYSTAVADAKVARDGLIAAAYATFTQATGTAAPAEVPAGE
jgi:hypothetical protein